MSLQNPGKSKADMLAAAKLRAKPDALATQEKPREYIPAEKATNKIRIVFDNSGSMAGAKIKNAKKGTVEFLRNCVPNQDAVAVHLLETPFSADLADTITNSVLMTDLTQLASDVDSEELRDYGLTPLFETIIRALDALPTANRLIVFSDGEPDSADLTKEKTAMNKAANNKVNGEPAKIPIDCVFIGQAGSYGAATLKRIAELTGGIFLVFDPAKGVNFATAFKYLAPGKRLMLADKSFAEKLQRGEVK